MITRFILVLPLVAALVSTARADIVYQMSFDAMGSSLNTNLNMNLGDAPQSFGVFLHELFIEGTDTPRIGINALDDGLITANFAVNRTAGTASEITNAAGNSLFDFGGVPTVNFDAISATVEQEIGVISDPVIATSSSAGRRTIQIGSLTVSGVGVGSTIFNLADFGVGDDLVIGDGINPGFVVEDSAGFALGSLSVTVTAVPEPSSMVLVGLVGCVGLLYRRKY